MMKTREQIIIDVQKFLVKAGFATSDPKDLAHAGFDIVARRVSTILVIKVMLNASSLNEQMLAGMKTLAHAVEGSPLLIALKSGNEPVEDGVTYSRSGIPLISFDTLRDLIEEGIPPMVYAASGGFYVNLDSDILRKAREGGLSLGDLAEMAGVSRRTIKMYEDGMSAKLEVAMRLEEGLGVELIVPVGPLTCNQTRVGNHVGNNLANNEQFEGMARDIFMKLNKIGYSVEAATRCPFDAVARDRDVVLFTGVDQKKPGLDKRAKAIANLSRVLEKHSVIFVDKLGERVNLEGTPLIGSSELKKAKDKKKVMDLIEERV
jgi:putative transcriptional regulator